ncbi:MAG: FG-GAP repeat protein [Ruminococcus sp.]|nr:FG-GAP repeat protein [Ruminococcus sp.]
MKKHGILKRTLAAVTALTMLSGIDLPEIIRPDPLTARAADSETNAAKALGLKEDAPEGFDEDDDMKNPYGRKAITFGEANEVLVGYQKDAYQSGTYDDDDQAGYYTINNSNTASPVSLQYYREIEEKDEYNNNAFLNNYISKTVAGNFDGNRQGRTNQYVRFSVGESVSRDSASLAVCDSLTGATNGTADFKLYNYTGKDMVGDQEFARENTYAISQMAVATGDFDGNGRDEIAALVNSTKCTETVPYEGNEKMSDFPDVNGHYDDPTGEHPNGYDLFVKREEHKDETGKDDGTGDILYKFIVYDWNDNYIDTALKNKVGMTRQELFEYMEPYPEVLILLPMLGIPIFREMRYYAMVADEGGSGNAEKHEVAANVYITDDYVGPVISIYAYTLNDGEGDLLNINDWELKRTFPVNPGEALSLAAGDVNGDGIDDLIVGESNARNLPEDRPATVTVYHGARKDMLANQTVIASGLDKYGVTVFESKSSTKRETYIGVLGSSGPNGAFSAYHFEDGKYRMLGEPKSVTMTVDRPALANEIYYLNDTLCSPNTKSCFKFSHRGLTAGNYNGFDAGFTEDFPAEEIKNREEVIAFDFQTADLNGDGKQTVFYQTIHNRGYWSYHGAAANSEIHSHSFGTSPNYSFDQPNACNMYAIVNTDNDSFYMSYTGKHWFEYTDPKVLAVLASPPYFKDLLEQDDLSGNYAESTTAYGSTKGAGSGSSQSNSFSVGAYVSFEQEISFMGFATVATFEAELSTDVSFTSEYEESVELNYSLEYATSSGADAVVFYSVPFEFYEYEIVYRENGKEKKINNLLCIPKQPCTATIELEKYQSIAENYSELPDLSNVLKHEVGNPDSYPKSTKGYNNVREFDGNYMAVDFTSAGGGITESQSIEMTKDTCYTSSIGVDVEMKVGGGAGGVTVGVSAGYGHEAGTMSTTTEGSSFTATMQNMPKEAEEYGYGMSWKLFSHEGSYKNASGNTVTFPVVDYLVTDVIQPPSLVSSFRQDYKNSSDYSVMLEWDYDDSGKAEFFNVFRVSNINGKQVRILVDTVPASSGTLNSDGSYTYTLEDKGNNANGGRIIMNPGVQYEYQIVAARSPSSPPCVSMPSEVLYAYTHAEGVYPEISLTGVTNNKLTVYPDREYNIGAEIGNADDFLFISYQWQKKEKTGWKDIANADSSILTISDPDADSAGKYRCRVDAMAFNEERNSEVGVTVFTDDIDLTFKMRSVKQNSYSVSCKGNKPEAVLSLVPSNTACLIAPTGTVEFTVQSASFENTYSVPLNASRRTSTAKLSDAADLKDLPNGIYQISAYYGGDNVYGSFQTEAVSVLVGNDAVYPVLFDQNGNRTETFFYGDKLTLKFYKYTKNADGVTSEQYMDTLTAQYGVKDQFLNSKPDTYTKNITADGKNYSYSYTLKKRPIEIGISDPGALFAGDVEGKLPEAVVISGLVEGDKLEEIATLVFKNGTDSSEITIDNRTAPGNYYAKLKPSQAEGNKTEYYDLQLYSEMISIYARLYDLNIICEKVDDQSAGGVRLTAPESISLETDTLRYESGTLVKLNANPYAGYVFDHWTVNGKTETSASTSFIMSPKAQEVHAFFAKDTSPSALGSVIVDETFMADGKIVYPNDFDSEKTYPVGKEFTFSAKDTSDSVFDYWSKVVGSKTYLISTRDITVAVTDTPVILYPVFKGAPCTITLGSGISAEYEAVNAQEESVKYTVTSGNTVPKGSELTISAPAGADYSWYINGVKQTTVQNTMSLIVSGDTNIEWKYSGPCTAQMDGHSLSLDGPITLNFYVDIKDYDNKALTAKIFSTHYDSTQKKEITTEIGTFAALDGAPCKYNTGFDEYRFSVPLAAAMINDRITMNVYTKGDTEPVLTDVYSVAEYANGKIASSSNKKLVNAMISLLDYGTQAQKYFDYNNIEANYANKSLTAEQIAAARTGITAYTTKMDNTDIIDRAAVNKILADNNIALTYTGSSLQLDSGVKLRYYFKPNSGTADAALAAYGNSIRFTDSSISASTGIEGNEIFIETDQLPAALLTSDNSYSLNIGNTVIIDGATINSYFKSIYVKDDSSAKRVQLKRVNESLYYYAESAKLYFGK